MNIPTVANFADVLVGRNYAAVPDDWLVAVGDVVGSTPAIAAGRYKDVNLAGAAVIAGVLNACPGQDLPFAFGGDGGVVLLPPALAQNGRAAMSGVQRIARNIFDLDMRCAVVPVKSIRAAGRDVRLVYQTLGPGRRLAMLSGGGIDQAEAYCKSADGAGFAVSAEETMTEADLTGLSCRWQPLSARNGVMLSLIVKTRGDDAAPDAMLGLYHALQAAAARDTCPVALSNLDMRWPPRGRALEVAMGADERKVLMQSFWQKLSTLTGLTIGGFNGRAYAAALPSHSDYRKFADSLRMVVDCSKAESAAIESILSDSKCAGLIDFGLHRATSALMTCLVHSTNDAGHVHFIDGSDGGYSMAAQGLKDQIASNGLS